MTSTIGEPFILNRFTVVASVSAPPEVGREFVFDPTDLLFLDGGVMLRMRDFDTDRPVLQVAHWNNRDSKTGEQRWVDFPMRLETDVEWADRLELEQQRRERAAVDRACERLFQRQRSEGR